MKIEIIILNLYQDKILKFISIHTCSKHFVLTTNYHCIWTKISATLDMTTCHQRIGNGIFEK